jgi:D-glycero-alpha-D-manno-heptose-7-phosphate kinase
MARTEAASRSGLGRGRAALAPSFANTTPQRAQDGPGAFASSNPQRGQTMSRMVAGAAPLGRIAHPMTQRIVEATAPTRIDLAGGTLDIWPVYLFHRGAVTVNVAIDRRAWCRVETGIAGVRIESKDTLAKAEGRDLDEVLASGSLALVAYILRALGIESGVKVVTQSRVPAGSGLGGSSALAVTIAAAASTAVGRPLDKDGLWPIVRDAEAQAIAVPTGIQDYLAAIHGGVLAIDLTPGQIGVNPSPADPARVEECLLLVDAGATRFSGINNWEVFKGQIDGDASVRAALGEIVASASALRDALAAHRYDDVPRLIAREWAARKRLAPGVTTPEVDAIVAAAESAGGAAKVCGAGGGGMVAVWAPPGRREAAAAAVQAAGFKPVPFRVDLRGLDVE